MKDNERISEFMGFPKEADAVDDRTIAYYVGESILWTDNTDNENEDDVFHPDDMQFHKSWDWLMPVVEKCLIGEAEHSEDVSNLAIKNIYESICNQDISLAHKSVVEFINQYNKNKKK